MSSIGEELVAVWVMGWKHCGVCRGDGDSVGSGVGVGGRAEKVLRLRRSLM
jgi:hypothetical protein